MSFLSRFFKKPKIEPVKPPSSAGVDDFSDWITDEEIHSSADWVIDLFLVARKSVPALSAIQFANDFFILKLAEWKRCEILSWLEKQHSRSERVTLFDLACQFKFPRGVSDYDHDRILMATQDRFLDRQDELPRDISGAMTYDEMREDIADCIANLEAEDAEERDD